MAQENTRIRTISFENEVEVIERTSSSTKPIGEQKQSKRDEEFSREFSAFLTRSSEARAEVRENKGTIVFNTPEVAVNVATEIIGAIASKETLKSVKQANVLAGQSIFELLKDYVFFRVKKEKNEQKNPEELKKEANKKSFYQSLKQFVGLGSERKLKLRKEAENINAKLGGNLSFEGVVSESMDIRVDIETLLNKKNSEMNERELQAKRARAIAMASKGKGKRGMVPVKQELNPEKGINAGQRNAYTQAG